MMLGRKRRREEGKGRSKREGGSGRQCSGKKLRGKSKVRTINGLGRGSVGIL